MFKDLKLEEFLEVNRISQESFETANITWDVLQAIAADHEAKSAKLEDSAEVIAKTIQKFNKVHSVRWRVKNTEHLIAKIIRKRAESCPKYADITPQNYFELVTDLVGVRALHLFKVDCFEIDQFIREAWNQIEDPVVYIRTGDSSDLKDQFEKKGFGVKEHPAGYRSVHYVIESTPHKRKIIAEIQVRTIFEEGWSEIDHQIRYPNFSSNELVAYFLEIFNRMAGSADDMGGFVLGLVGAINQFQNEIEDEKKQKDTTLHAMEQALHQLKSEKEQGDESKTIIANLKAEIAKLKNTKNESIPLIGRGLFGNIPPNIATFGLVAESNKKTLANLLKVNSTIAGLATTNNLAQALALRSSSALDLTKIPNYNDTITNILKNSTRIPPIPKGLLGSDD